MLTFDTLLKYLNLQQEKLLNLYEQDSFDNEKGSFIKYMNNNYNETLSLPDFVVSIDTDFSDYYYVDNNNKNSFIYSILYLLDNNFISELEKNMYINNFRKKLCYDLEGKNLYREFNYVKLRKFKKDAMQKNLLDFKNEIDEYIQQYISDYFGINIYIFSDKNISHILSHNDSDESNPYKPTILLIYKNGYFMPIMNKQFGGILIYSQVNLVDKLFKKYVKNSKLNIQQSTISDTIVTKRISIKKSTTLKSNTNILLKPVKKMLLGELQNMAEEYDIDTMKDGAKGKKIVKTKNELYEELKNII